MNNKNIIRKQADIIKFSISSTMYVRTYVVSVIESCAPSKVVQYTVHYIVHTSLCGNIFGNILTRYYILTWLDHLSH